LDHTFAIPVYRAAPNLAALISSLRAQTGPGSEILLASSTPTAELKEFASRHALALHLNPLRIDIAADWNFALAAARTQLVTIAHQDDVFEPTYTESLRGALRRHPEAGLAYCDYSEHTPRGARPTNINLCVKRALSRRAFGTRECISDPRDKLRLLSLGNPICCPSVMFDRSILADFRFRSGFQSNLDWKAWSELARRPGGFVYVRQRLVSKGVHPHSETTAAIASRARAREDRAMFDKFWSRPIAGVLSTLYSLAYQANRF
jgi:glycosyltransferase involved in cell wall biosynthesis